MPLPPRVMGRCGARAVARFLLGLVVLGMTAQNATAQSVVPPDLMWRTFATPHVEVIFGPDLEPEARHAAARAEAALSTLRARGFGQLPSERIQLIVSDHTDLPLGLAGVIPYPRIVVGTQPPVHGPQAMPFEDWLDFVILHEMVHILHLESTGRLGRAARRIFGRVPVAWPFFPAFALPSWALEGVAVHGETAHTGGGRLYGTRFESVLHAQALAGQSDRLDQAMGPSPRFPGGERPYIGGGAFFHDLAEQEGTAAVDAFFHRQATRLNPLRLNASARDALGMTLADAHARWVRGVKADAEALEASVQARAEARARAEDGAPSPQVPTRLTEGARMAAFPVLLPAGDAGSDPAGMLVWMEQRGGSDLRLRGMRWPAGPTDSTPASSELPTPRLHSMSPLSRGPDGNLWTAQLEAQDRYRIQGELWKLRLGAGEVGRLGGGARIVQVDVHPGHGEIAAVLEVTGTNTLAILTSDGLSERWRLPANPEVHWTAPRWSPAGDVLAAVQWSRGGVWRVGVLAPSAERPRFIPVAEGRAPIHGVTWTADGRHLIWSSEQSGVANLYAAVVPDVATEATADSAAESAAILQITDIATAAHHPTVIGEDLFFSLLGAEGWDLVVMPLDPSRWFAPIPVDPRFVRAGPASAQAAPREADPSRTAAASAPATVWRPWSTLRPRHWIPWGQRAQYEGDARVLAPTLGFETWGRDAVGRHAWDLALAFPLEGSGRRWEGAAGWQWAGLGDPVLTGRFSREWTSLGPIAGSPFYLAARDASVGISAAFLRPRLSSAYQLSMGARSLRESLVLLEADGSVTEAARLRRPVRDVVEGSLALSYSNVRATPMAPGPQTGTSAVIRLRSRMEPGLPDSLQQRPGPGGDARRDDLLLSLRHFIPLPGGMGTGMSARAGGAPPVLALRGAAGVARGPGAGPTTWALGGGGGGGATRLGMTWDRPPGVFQVRGWQEGVLRGERVWGAGGELRIPAAVIHRGFGVLPLYLDRLAVAGWIDGAGSENGALAASGFEAVLLHGDFSWQPGVLRAGVAFPLGSTTTGDPLPRPSASIYAALGWSF